MRSLESWVLTYVLNSAWQAPLIFAAAWIAARTVRRSGAAMEHRIWVSALALEALLPACSVQPGPLFREVWQLAMYAWRKSAADGATGITTITGAGDAHEVLRLPMALLASLTAVYGCSVAYFAGRLLWGVWNTGTLRRRSLETVLTGEAAHSWNRCCRTFAVHDATVAVSRDISGPITMGVCHRLILLPMQWDASLPWEDLEAAMAHEFAHARRRDFAKNLLYELLSLPIAYHPLLWLTRARLSESREMVCDTMAADAVAGRERYARSLLRLASLLVQGTQARTLHAIGIFDANNFERRVMSLTEQRVELSGARKWAVVATCFALGLGTFASAMALHMNVSSPALQTEAQPAGGGQQGLLHIGGAVLPPKVIQTVNPVYSEAARQAKFSGKVRVYLWVDENGNPSNVRVVHGVGMGLDEKAVEAIRQYKFKPATLDGRPVTVDLYIDVNFQIFQK